MKYPEGAIRTDKQMEKLFGKKVYMVLPPDIKSPAPRVDSWIIKMTPCSFAGEPWLNDFILMVEERVGAAHDFGIATRKDWTVYWGNGRELRYYFANFWHAYAHSLTLRQS